MLLIDQVVLRRYVILELLPEGGQYLAARAKDQKTGRIVVVKQLSIPQGRSASRLAVARFKRESSLRIDHPRVADVIDSGKEDGHWYLVVLFVNGPDLEHHVLNYAGKLPAADAATIVEQTAEALAAIHAKDVVHRDIKPSNIIVDPRTGARVIDLGICRVLNEQTLSRGDGILGSLAWMAPEQVVDASQVDARADLYALGAVFYFALTGRCPAVGETPEALALNICQCVPPAPRTVDVSIPEQFDRLCMRLLAKNPDERFHSAEEFRRALHGTAAPGSNLQHCTACSFPMKAPSTFCTRCGAAVLAARVAETHCLACGRVVNSQSACPSCHRPFSPEGHELRVVAGSAAGIVFRMPEGIYIVGRSQLCARNRHISSRQFSVACVNGTVQIQHAGGVNMTFVGHRRANSPMSLDSKVQLCFAGNITVYTNKKGAQTP